MKVFIGWDPRDHQAYCTAVHSLRANTNAAVEIYPIIERDLRAAGLYWRTFHVEQNGQMIDNLDGKPFSTQFSFTRFLVPELMEFADEWVLFIDPDVMFRADIEELFGLIEPDKAIMCVPHTQVVKEAIKMDGVRQENYLRKNWSSVMAVNPARCQAATRMLVNNASGSELHALRFVDDSMIGFLPEEWNWLENYSDADMKPKLVHFTRGTPDMIGGTMYAEEWWQNYDHANVGYPLFRPRNNA
jgi:lipopolysaccharide biosynthesis glycosyltransferase